MANGNRKNNGYSINANTTLSISLVGTIVAASISMGTMWAQISGLQQQIINNQIAATVTFQRDEKDVERLNAKFLTRDSSEEYRRHVEDIISRHDREFEKINSNIFRREEHLLKWGGYDRQFSDMQRQIDETKRDISQIFPTTKVMDEIIKRIDRLEVTHINAK